MSGVSREEAVALGEGVTAGPWKRAGRHGRLIVGPGADDWVAAVSAKRPEHAPSDADFGVILAAPRLRETVVELHDRVAELAREADRLRAQVADVGWSGDWFTLDGVRLRWLRVHGGTDDQTWHLIDDGMIAPQASLWRDEPGGWFGRKPNAGAVQRPTAAAACDALYPGLMPPAGCEPP